MKPRLSRNMLPNINTCENGWSYFSANLRVVSLKLLELAQFAWPNLSIYFNFLCAVPRDDVIESTRFLMRLPVIIPPWSQPSLTTRDRELVSVLDVRIESGDLNPRPTTPQSVTLPTIPRAVSKVFELLVSVSLGWFMERSDVYPTTSLLIRKVWVPVIHF